MTWSRTVVSGVDEDNVHISAECGPKPWWGKVESLLQLTGFWRTSCWAARRGHVLSPVTTEIVMECLLANRQYLNFTRDEISAARTGCPHDWPGADLACIRGWRTSSRKGGCHQ